MLSEEVGPTQKTISIKDTSNRSLFDLACFPQGWGSEGQGRAQERVQHHGQLRGLIPFPTLGGAAALRSFWCGQSLEDEP